MSSILQLKFEQSKLSNTVNGKLLAMFNHFHSLRVKKNNIVTTMNMFLPKNTSKNYTTTFTAQ